MIKDSRIRKWYEKNKDHKKNEIAKILGVEYAHLKLKNNSDLYFTKHGLPFIENLKPENFWIDKRWLGKNSKRLLGTGRAYRVKTKKVNGRHKYIVIKWNRMGQDIPGAEDCEELMNAEFNSPFEEIAMTVEFSQKEIATIYPRAIYMSEYKTDISKNLFDNSRYESHKDYKTPDGIPILKKNRDYIIIWGYWNGPDEKLAAKDSDYYEGIDALRAYKEKRIDEDMYIDLLKLTKEKLHKEGIDDLNLRGNHILISYDSKGNLITDNQGSPEIRICNFEFLKRID